MTILSVHFKLQTMKNSKIPLLSSILLLFVALSYSPSVVAQNSKEQTPWVAPVEADELVNPLKDEALALILGKRIYTSECQVCHGKYGNAETEIAETFEQKPKNFTKEDFINQSDGAIFWKLSEGRGLMQPFKTMLSEEEIWSVVTQCDVG